MVSREIITLRSESHTKMNSLCRENGEFLNVKVGGTNSYQYAVKD